MFDFQNSTKNISWKRANSGNKFVRFYLLLTIVNCLVNNQQQGRIVNLFNLAKLNCTVERTHKKLTKIKKLNLYTTVINEKIKRK